MQNPIWENVVGKSTKDNETDYDEILKKIPIFANLSKTELSLVEHIMHKRKYDKDEFIVEEGRPGVGMFIIERGIVSITSFNSEGEEFEIAKLNEGAFFGEIALLDDSPRTASARALNTCNMLIFFRPDLFDLMEKKPKLGSKILMELGRFLIGRLESAREKLAEKQNKSNEKDIK